MTIRGNRHSRPVHLVRPVRVGAAVAVVLAGCAFAVPGASAATPTVTAGTIATTTPVADSSMRASFTLKTSSGTVAATQERIVATNSGGTATAFGAATIPSGQLTTTATTYITGRGQLSAAGTYTLTAQYYSSANTWVSVTPTTSLTVKAAGTTTQPTWATSSYGAPALDDEFNSNALNTSTWVNGWYPHDSTSLTGPVNDQENACYNPANVSVSTTNGVGTLNLALKAVTPPANATGCAAMPYQGALVTTKGVSGEAVSGGSYEARVYLPAATDGTRVAAWPAVWLDGENSGVNGDDWPNDGEIDTLEGFGASTSTLHFPPACNQSNWTASTSSALNPLSTAPLAGWHYYGMSWNTANQTITTYWDGKPITYTRTTYTDCSKSTVASTQSTTTPSFPVTAAESIILNNTNGDSSLHPNYAAATSVMQVDWVRYWTRTS